MLTFIGLVLAVTAGFAAREAAAWVSGKMPIVTRAFAEGEARVKTCTEMLGLAWAALRTDNKEFDRQFVSHTQTELDV